MANGDGIELVEDGQTDAADNTGEGSGNDTGENSGGTGGGEFGTSDGGANTAGETDARADSGTGEHTGSDGTAGDSAGGQTQQVTQLILLDSDGNQIGVVPLSFDDGSVSMEVGTVTETQAPEGFYVQTGEQLGLITAGTVLALVLIFAIFGTLCVGTLIRSFEWKQ